MSYQQPTLLATGEMSALLQKAVLVDLAEHPLQHQSLVWTTIPSQLDHCNGLQTGFLFYTVPSVIFLKLSSYVAMMYNYFKN